MTRTPRRSVSSGGLAALAIFLALAGSAEGRAKGKGFCSETARLLFGACRASVMDDSLVKKAICVNISDAGKRAACASELETARKDGNEECRAQRGWRLDACKSVGEDRYDPNFDPALFDDPRAPTKPNPYFPLAVGDRWEYRGGNEVDTVEVTNETKLIAGVRCIVVRDIVVRNGDTAEATDDWYASAKNGESWYFGEETKDYESFDGDDPRRPELISIDGAFKAGREGDKPGIIFLASPKPGDVYVEESSLANAEDVTEILSTTYAFGNDPELDQSVPRQLAELLCTGDCVVTKDFSLLEPGIFARKYFARGIGVFLEVESEGLVSQLVSCNFDSRCGSLPTP